MVERSDTTGYDDEIFHQTPVGVAAARATTPAGVGMTGRPIAPGREAQPGANGYDPCRGRDDGPFTPVAKRTRG